MPVVRITFDWQENEQRCAAYSATKSEQWLREAGATETWSSVAGADHLSLHAYGGTRMGDDPASSVVDRWCFAHEVPNLGVLGASCMPTSGSHNPALTVQALAWRTADHLVGAWGSIAE
jgi:gluconate 2-dehydrogenase alpha chain